MQTDEWRCGVRNEQPLTCVHARRRPASRQDGRPRGQAKVLQSCPSPAHEEPRRRSRPSPDTDRAAGQRRWRRRRQRRRAERRWWRSGGGCDSWARPRQPDGRLPPRGLRVPRLGPSRLSDSNSHSDSRRPTPDARRPTPVLHPRLPPFTSHHHLPPVRPPSPSRPSTVSLPSFHRLPPVRPPSPSRPFTVSLPSFHRLCPALLQPWTLLPAVAAHPDVRRSALPLPPRARSWSFSTVRLRRPTPDARRPTPDARRSTPDVRSLSCRRPPTWDASLSTVLWPSLRLC